MVYRDGDPLQTPRPAACAFTQTPGVVKAAAEPAEETGALSQQTVLGHRKSGCPANGERGTWKTHQAVLQ